MIVKTKQFAVKPMTPEEAVLQLELIGHDFFVFRNADVERGQRRLPAPRRRLRADRAAVTSGAGRSTEARAAAHERLGR